MSPLNNHYGYQGEPIAVVIPAYNEAERIGNVLHATMRVPHVAEIIVVDDGSQDETAKVVTEWQLRDRRIQLIVQAENQGKAAAIRAGAQRARGDIVTMLDADLSGLQPHHIRQLIAPVRRGEYAMTMGLFQNGRRSTDVTHRFLPFLSGQRCLRWSLFEGTLSLPNAGWSLETALNLHAWYHQYPTKRVPWQGVTHAMRPEKQPGLSGYTSHVAMWSHIIRYTFQFVRRAGIVSIVDRLQRPQPANPALVLSYETARSQRSVVMRRPFL